MTLLPTSDDVANVAGHLVDQCPVRVERFNTGLAHFVYEVWFEDGTSLVARMTGPESLADFRGAVYWQEWLETAEVPFARILASDLDSNWPTLILERLPGTDLQYVYPDLTVEQRSAIAREIAAIQTRVARMPTATGYGYARSYDDPDLLPTWTDLLSNQINRSRQRIRSAGIVDDIVCDGVDQVIETNRDRLNGIPPTPFLDDTTTKNVIVDNGRLSGIVDIDCICFGDPLFAIALTRMAVLSRHWPDDYIETWFGAVGFGDDDRWRLDLYTAMHACGFLSEFGQTFNQDKPGPVDSGQIQHLTTLADQFVSSSGTR